MGLLRYVKQTALLIRNSRFPNRILQHRDRKESENIELQIDNLRMKDKKCVIMKVLMKVVWFRCETVNLLESINLMNQFCECIFDVNAFD